MLLAGDVGGTRTRLGLYEPASPRPHLVEQRAFTTLDFDGIGEIIERFLNDLARSSRDIETSCLGVAGPVTGKTARLTNVPWPVDAGALERRFGWRRAFLINDLEATAYAVPVLQPDEQAVLQKGLVLDSTGNAAIIAAGTGLGEALLHRIDGTFVPAASEGGHADFCARTPDELELVAALTRVYGRAECEHVLSGPGIVNLFRFTHGLLREGPFHLIAPRDCRGITTATDLAGLPAQITASALERRCERCVRALEMFVAAYGAEAGNLALRTVATAGVYLAGGIAPKILPALERGPFLDAFCRKPPLVEMLSAIRIAVVLNQEAGLLGAAVCANQRHS